MLQQSNSLRNGPYEHMKLTKIEKLLLEKETTRKPKKLKIKKRQQQEDI